MNLKKVYGMLLLACSVGAFAQSFKVSSPNNQIVLGVSLNNQGALTYGVQYKNKEVIESSKLGFKIQDQPDLMNNFSIIKVDSSAHNDTWQPVWGETKNIGNN